MVTLIAIAVVLIVIASTWWMGLWSNFLNLINFFLAALIASSFYENLAWFLQDSSPSYAYLADFVAVWGTFVVAFVVLRVITDLLSGIRLKFDPITEYTGRSLLSLWLALAFLAFTSFTLHMAPLPPDAFQTSPNERFLGVGPDRMWLAFIQSRSRGALSAARDSDLFPNYADHAYTRTPHPDDLELDARVFDPLGEFIFEQRARRVRISLKQVLLD